VAAAANNMALVIVVDRVLEHPGLLTVAVMDYSQQVPVAAMVTMAVLPVADTMLLAAVVPVLLDQDILAQAALVKNGRLVLEHTMQVVAPAGMQWVGPAAVVTELFKLVITLAKTA